MPTPFAFLLSMYLTLILGGVALGYAEYDYLPEVTALTAVVVLLMVVAFVMDLRGRYLSLERANVLGVVIFAVTGVWITLAYRNPDSLLNRLPWPAGSLPYVAPLLMVLTPAKLLRPKHVGDWWGLQLMCLCGVGLSVSLAEDPLNMALVLIYAVSAVWSLTLFYLYRAAGRVAPYPVREVRGWRRWLTPGFWFPALQAKPVATVAAAFEGVTVPTPAERLGRSHFLRALRWIAAAAAVAAPLFFLTPRIDGFHWELFNVRAETGYSADGAPDLSRTGTLRLNKEIAFEVSVRTRDNAPVTALPGDMRWRGTGYQDYVPLRGRWQKLVNMNPIYRSAPRMVFPASEEFRHPEFGPGVWYYDYTIVGKTGGPVFADPASFRIGERIPAAIPYRDGFNYGLLGWDASFVLLRGRNPSLISRYIQAGPPMVGPSAAAPGEFALEAEDEPLAPFLAAPPAEVADYARRTLERLFNERILGSAIRNRWSQFGERVHPNDFAAVAAAFTAHFSDGSFGYSLDLRRTSKDTDPVADFLLNVRQGHCERFASALVLMLRGVGVPAQLVTGFRGAEAVGPGKYVVRNEHAHAWAEVLIGSPGPDGGRWRWQAYDPTPAFSAALETAGTGLLDTGAKEGKRLLAEYVVGLNSESQRRLNEGVSDFFETNGPAVAAIVALAALASLMRFRRRIAGAVAADPAVVVPWYDAWLKKLAGTPLAKHPSETPREHAVRIAPQCVSNLSLPLKLAELLERLRYAGGAVSAAEVAAVSADVQSFQPV